MPYAASDELAQAMMSSPNGRLSLFRSESLVAGLNNRYAARFIRNDQASTLLNVDLDDVTRPKLRDGYLVLASAATLMQNGIDSGLLSSRIAGFSYLHTAAATKLLVIAINKASAGRVYRRASVAAGGSWAECFSTATVSLSVETDDAVMFQANDGMYIVPDSSVNVHTMDSAGALADGGNTNTSPPKGAVDGCYFLSRAWLFKQGTGSLPPELHYSKLLPSSATPSADWGRDGTTVSSTLAGRLQLSPNWGGTAVASRPWNETSIMAFFNNCIEEVIVNSANPQADSIRRIIEPRWGCCSKDSVVTVGQEMFFADQFGAVRSLQQTVNGDQGGVVAKPVSEAIATEIPGSVNQAALSKIQGIAFKDKLYVAFPRQSATQANAVAVYSLSLRIWESIWTFARPIGRMVISNIRGSGDELWFSDGGNDATTPYAKTAKCYRMFPGTYTDDGTAIAYCEASKAYDSDSPECDKLPEWIELEARGSAGAQAELLITAGEDGSPQSIGTMTVAGNAASSFPLTSSSFPLTASSFPLTDPAPGIARKVFRIPSTTNYSRARMHQLTIKASQSGKQFHRIGYRFAAAVEPYKAEDPE